MLRKTPVALALAGGLQAAFGQATPAPTPATPTATTPAPQTIIVTATRTERRADEVPATVTVKTREQIDGARDVKDLFADEIDVSVRAAGARYTSTGGSGRAGNESINIRGLEGNQVLLLVDGIRVPNTFSFGPFVTGRGDFLALDGAQAVEVLRGPASTAYGSDGLAGAVSLRTLEPADLLRRGQGQGVGGFGRLGYTSVDDAWAASAGAAFGGAAWQAMVLASVLQGHETENRGSNDAPNSTRTVPDPQDVSAPSLLAKLRWHPAPAHRLGLTLDAQRRTVDTEAYSARTASATPASTAVIDLDTHDTLERQRVSLEHHYESDREGGLQRAETRVYAQTAKVRQTAVEDRFSAADRTRDNRYEQKVAGLSTQGETRLDHGSVVQRLSYGVDVSRSEITGLRNGTVPPAGEAFPAKPFPDTTYTLAGAFVQSEVDVGAWTVIPGLRADRYELSPSSDGYAAPVVSLSDSALTPRLGALWRIAPTFVPYGQVALGFRAPTPDQVNNSFTNTTQLYKSISNPDLKAEHAQSVELGFRGSAGGWRYSVAGYDNRYRDFIAQRSFIDAADGLTTFQYVNLSRARIRGVEARVEWQIDPRWRLSGGSAYVSGRSDSGGDTQPLDSVDPLRSVLGLRYDDGVWQWRANLVHSQGKAQSRTTAVATQTGSTPQFTPQHYTVLDLGAGWKPLPGWTFSAAVNNVFDVKYWRWSDVRGQPAASAVIDAFTAPGRNVQVAARYDY